MGFCPEPLLVCLPNGELVHTSSQHLFSSRALSLPRASPPSVLPTQRVPSLQEGTLLPEALPDSHSLSLSPGKQALGTNCLFQRGLDLPESDLFVPAPTFFISLDATLLGSSIFLIALIASTFIFF